MTESEKMTVIPIAPDSKYCVVSDKRLTMREAEKIAEELDDWWESDRPFCVLSDCLRLVRVDVDMGGKL